MKTHLSVIRNIRSLNQSGFDHIFGAVFCFVIVGIVGATMLVISHAATVQTVHWKGMLEEGSGSSNYCLTSSGTTNNGKIYLDPCVTSMSKNQTWSLSYVKQATILGAKNVQEFTLQTSAGTNECLNDPYGSKTNGVAMQIYACHNTDPNSLWVWGGQIAGKGLWTSQLVNVATTTDNNALCLDDAYGAHTTGNKVQLWSCNSAFSANQNWFESGATSGSGSGSGGSGTGTITAACTMSGATGAGSPTYAITVAAPTSADSTATINNAIISASSHGGGVVILKPGTYTIDGHIVMKSNVVLSGTEMASTILKAGPTFMATTDDGGYPIISTDGAKNVTIENLEANQDADGLHTAGKVSESTAGRLNAWVVNVVNGSNVIVQDVAVRDQFTYSLVAYNTTKFCFRNDYIQLNPAVNGDFDQLDGIHVMNATFGDVLDNYVDQRYGGATDGGNGITTHAMQGLSDHDITFAGNVIRGGSGGADMELAPAGELYNLTIENNEFYGGPFGISTAIPGTGTNNLSNVTISGNNIHNNQPGSVFTKGGEAIDIGGTEVSGGLKSATGVVIKNNKQCLATDNGKDGPFSVITGTGNLLSNNTTYTGCTDVAGSSPASN